MKVIINGKENAFVDIFRPFAGYDENDKPIYCPFYQCNTRGNESAHNFNTHPRYFPKDKEIKTNGCVYIFPSK